MERISLARYRVTLIKSGSRNEQLHDAKGRGKKEGWMSDYDWKTLEFASEINNVFPLSFFSLEDHS